jgi:hypothetical protein
VVQFYGGDRELASSVSGYLAESIKAGDSVVVVATRPHRLVFEDELIAAGVDTRAAGASGRLLMLDAAETLQGFLDSGRLDHGCFDATVSRVVRQVASAGPPIRIYAEMVALLWDAGQVTLALELEELWNDLALLVPFWLLCGYPARLAADEASTADAEAVCRLHSGVIGPWPGLGCGQEIPGREGEAVRSFPGVLEATRAARQFVADVLRWRGEEALARDAAILTAELAANAVLHAGSSFTVAVWQSADGIRISVLDTGLGHPAGEGGWLTAAPGHGLDVVAKIASRWAVEDVAGGKVVWAELPASPRHAG